jgi:hypothetical protein
LIGRSGSLSRKVGDGHLANSVTGGGDTEGSALVLDVVRESEARLSTVDVFHEDDGKTGLHVPLDCTRKEQGESAQGTGEKEGRKEAEEEEDRKGKEMTKKTYCGNGRSRLQGCQTSRRG